MRGYLVRRQFRASRPGELVVADFTCVPMGTSRFGYTAFVIDAFAGVIPGWECSLSKKTAFVGVSRGSHLHQRHVNGCSGTFSQKVCHSSSPHFIGGSGRGICQPR
jgi:hypothetical protein